MTIPAKARHFPTGKARASPPMACACTGYVGNGTLVAIPGSQSRDRAAQGALHRWFETHPQMRETEDSAVLIESPPRVL